MPPHACDRAATVVRVARLGWAGYHFFATQLGCPVGQRTSTGQNARDGLFRQAGATEANQLVH